ncbi:WG repeat-containing protein [Cellulophaga fucicola]|uniref:WG repeat-containing protein n=1 Tax=Cellulophaga fucicola TaxID=76595 RepID=UPI003EB84A8B
MYNEIKYIGYFDITIVENNKGFYDILDSTLKKINFSPYQLLYTKNLNKSKIIVAKQKEKYGIIDKNNNIVIPLVYDYISGTYDDKLIVQINNKAKVINLENKIILNTNFESISKPDYNNNHLVKKDFRQGIMNKNGKLLIPVKYKEIRIRNSLNAYFVYEDKEGLRKVGLYDLDCNLKIPIKYKYLTVVSHKNSENYSSTNRLIAKINGKYGVIDLDDNIVINHKYKSIKVIEQYIKDNILKNLASETKDIKKIEFIRDFFKGYVYEIIDFEKNTFLMNEKEEIIKTSYNNGYN